jgi:hypothetical protein
VLLLQLEPLLSEAIYQSILVNLFQVPRTVVLMNPKGGFSDDVTQGIEGGSIHSLSNVVVILFGPTGPPEATKDTKMDQEKDFNTMFLLLCFLSLFVAKVSSKRNPLVATKRHKGHKKGDQGRDLIDASPLVLFEPFCG